MTPTKRNAPDDSMMDNRSPPTVTEIERARIATEYEMWESIFLKRHGITAAEVAESVKWYQHHREWLSAMKRGGSLATIGFVLSAVLLLLWEGFKLAVRRNS